MAYTAKMAKNVPLSLLLLTGVIASCTANDDPMRPEADDADESAMMPDAVELDAGTRSIDAATRPADAATHADDAATGAMDAATHAVDAATHAVDAATHAVDAATHAVDAATHPVDAATHPVDAATDAGSPSDAAAADAGAVQSCSVDSKAVWSMCGFHVEAGKCYELTTTIDDQWLDLDVPADLGGWLNKQDPRLVLFKPFRRVVQDDIDFYQFAACVDQQLDQCFPVGALTTTCPKISGELAFFLNDASGFESNNVGTATVTFRAKD